MNPLGSKHFRDEIRQAVSGKALGDHLADLLKAERGDIRGVLDVRSPIFPPSQPVLELSG